MRGGAEPAPRVSGRIQFFPDGQADSIRIRVILTRIRKPEFLSPLNTAIFTVSQMRGGGLKPAPRGHVQFSLLSPWLMLEDVDSYIYFTWVLDRIILSPLRIDREGIYTPQHRGVHSIQEGGGALFLTLSVHTPVFIRLKRVYTFYNIHACSVSDNLSPLKMT